MILRKWSILPVTLIALWSWHTISFNLSRYSGYYTQRLPHKKGTNPEWICSLKELYYLKKPHHLELMYDYNGDFFISNYQEPTTMSSYSILV